MSIIGTIYEDVTTDVLGHIGSWQWLVTFISTALLTSALWNQYEDTILLEPPQYIQCKIVDSSPVFNSSLCFYTTLNGTKEHRCNKWQVKFLWVFWIKKTWLVFCDRKLKLLSITIICRLGSIFGCILSGIVADSFGRKLSITMNVFAECVFRLILSFCDSESWFHLIVFLKSLFASANIYLGIVLTCEIASTTWRTLLSTVVCLPRMLATVCVVPLANAVPNSDTQNFIAGVFSVCLILLLRWVPESPQWLLYNRKIQEAEKIIVKAAKMNGVELCNDFKIRPVNQRAYACLDETWTCIGVLTTYNIRVLSLVTLIFWTLYHFLWSSLYLRIFYKRHQYALLNILSLSTLLGLLNWCLSKKVKLKFLLMINSTVIGATSIFLICAKILKINNAFTNIISALGLATGVITHGIIVNITARLFSLNIRATLMGCCHSSGQVGSILCYVLVSFYAVDNTVLMIAEVGVAMFLTVLCCILPDVDRRELPDVIEDMDYFLE